MTKQILNAYKGKDLDLDYEFTKKQYQALKNKSLEEVAIAIKEIQTGQTE